MSSTAPADLMAIGAFARRARLSLKASRLPDPEPDQPFCDIAFPIG